MKQQTIDGLREFLAGGGHPTRQTGIHYFMSLAEAADVLALVAEVERLRAELAAERERCADIAFDVGGGIGEEIAARIRDGQLAGAGVAESGK